MQQERKDLRDQKKEIPFNDDVWQRQRKDLQGNIYVICVIKEFPCEINKDLARKEYSRDLLNQQKSKFL
jgi:hypothetical protein